MSQHAFRVEDQLRVGPPPVASNNTRTRLPACQNPGAIQLVDRPFAAPQQLRRLLHAQLLEKFTKAGDSRFGKVQSVWSYRGDCTETGDRRLRATMPEEAYEHHHWNTVACNGGVLVCVPRWKSSEERGERVGLDAPYWWAMSEIAAAEPDPALGIRPANVNEIAAVVTETQELLAMLPGLEYMRIAKVGYYSTGKNGRRFDKAPQDVRFFRFAAGYGCVSLRKGASR